MYKHIVIWNFKEEFTPEENKEHAAKAKRELEALPGLIPGVVELKVYTELLPSGDTDVILESVFESEEALANYTPHPEHQRVAEYIRTVFTNRRCADYRI